MARMAYPTFVARALPFGSGAVESACKVLISKRHKGADMRGTREGAQAIASLRALYSSAHDRWNVCWASKPLTRLRLLPPAAATAPSTAPNPCRPSDAPSERRAAPARPRRSRALREHGRPCATSRRRAHLLRRQALGQGERLLAAQPCLPPAFRSSRLSCTKVGCTPPPLVACKLVACSSY